MPITLPPTEPFDSALIKQLVQRALDEVGAVTSIPPTEDESRVDNLYVIEVEGHPRLNVEYEEV